VRENLAILDALLALDDEEKRGSRSLSDSVPLNPAREDDARAHQPLRGPCAISLRLQTKVEEEEVEERPILGAFARCTLRHLAKFAPVPSREGTLTFLGIELSNLTIRYRLPD